jgi:hypothetical protein
MGQELQPKDVVLAANVIFGQSSQISAPARLWYLPGKQSSHRVAPTEAIAFPAAHAVQLLDPLLAAKVVFGQSSQMNWPARF